MKVILLKQLKNKGIKGDIVVVKDGFALNYLIPKKIAIYCNKENINYNNKYLKNLEKIKREKENELNSLYQKLNKKELTFFLKAKKNSEEVYGSINITQFLKHLNQELKTNVNKNMLVNFKKFDAFKKYKIKIKIKEDLIAFVWINLKKQT